MITLFTTARSLVRGSSILQYNAIRSWLAAPVDVQVLVIGKCENGEAAAKELGITYLPECDTDPNGVPLIGSLFEVAQQHASNDLLCYLNADIILPAKFYKTLRDIQNRRREFLVAGQRMDVDVDREFEFSDRWDKSFTLQFGQGEIHPPAGSDFFAFPKGQYGEGEIPFMKVGRPGWDLWMIYNARKRFIPAIDISNDVKVIHQNHDYSHRIPDEELYCNLVHLPANRDYLFTLAACDFTYRDGVFSGNKARGDIITYVKTQKVLEQQYSAADQLQNVAARIARFLKGSKAA